MNQQLPDAWGAMWSVVEWARRWGISETQAHKLRKHPKFPADATVDLGLRCVRFRAARLEEFAATLAGESKPRARPERLERGKQQAAAKRDIAAGWVASAPVAKPDAEVATT